MRKLIVANWKMYLDYQETYSWLEANGQELITLCESKTAQVVLCPLMLILAQAQKLVPKNNSIFWGAQDVSAFTKGAYTGQVSAQSLAQVGATYCLVGHHEHELYLGQTKQLAAQKAQALINAHIRPIILIGEKSQQDNWEMVLTEQLTLFKELLPDKANNNITPVYFAYEPAWSIGTGNILAPEALTARIQFIKQFTNNTVPVLYGGSVNLQTISSLLPLPLDGFLLGAISTDFQMLKKIVNLVY